MKKLVRRIPFLLVASSAFLFFGCAELFDCIAKASPDIHSKALNTGHVGSSYNDFIDSDITNDANDDDYEYFYSITGNIPPGMTYHQQGRKIYFTGTPSNAGSFTFEVRLTVDPPENYDEDGGLFNDDDRICFGDDTTTKKFTITIQ